MSSYDSLKLQTAAKSVDPKLSEIDCSAIEANSAPLQCFSDSIISFFAIILVLGLLSTLGLSCSFLSSSITYYDATTYKSLTDLKPQVVFLYESLGEDSMDTREIRSVRLKLNQMLEYEKGKGPKNRETAEQIKTVRDMFEDDIQHRMKNGKWSAAQLKNQIENISDAFDIAISTERLKNKNQ